MRCYQVVVPMNITMNIRKTTLEDIDSVHLLYSSVAETPGGLARLKDEVNRDYIENFVQKSLESGLSLVVEYKEKIVGEIHAYSPQLYCFSHVLSDLTIAIDTHVQGQGIGRKLFSIFLQYVTNEMSHITRVELLARASNKKALKFYESLGFQKEGEFTNRIKNIDGTYRSDIPFAWFRI